MGHPVQCIRFDELLQVKCLLGSGAGDPVGAAAGVDPSLNGGGAPRRGRRDRAAGRPLRLHGDADRGAGRGVAEHAGGQVGDQRAPQGMAGHSHVDGDPSGLGTSGGCSYLLFKQEGEYPKPKSNGGYILSSKCR